MIWDAAYDEPWCLISDRADLTGRELGVRASPGYRVNFSKCISGLPGFLHSCQVSTGSDKTLRPYLIPRPTFQQEKPPAITVITGGS